MGSKKISRAEKSVQPPQSDGIRRLTDDELRRATHRLARRHPEFRRVVRTFGVPPMWAREPGFGTLLHIILEQQVSLQSARAAFDRLSDAAAPLTPSTFLRFDDDELKGFGFSRQKTRYGRELAISLQDGRLDLERLGALPDEAAASHLCAVTGIGAWTSSIYMLMVLLRPDIWPRGDLALASAAEAVFALPKRPTDAELAAMSEQWRPWRAVAARLLWHHYLSVRGRS